MTASINLLSSTSNGTVDTNPTHTSGSFTPTASTKLYAFAIGESLNSSAAHVWGCTGGSLSWTQIHASAMATWNGDANFSISVVLFEATSGASPGSMTVTIDANTGSGIFFFYSLIVFECPGTSVAIKSGQSAVNSASKGGGASETHTSASLPGAATTGNRCVVGFGATGDAVGACATPSGWTSLASQSQTWTHVGVFHRSDFTGTNVACTDLGETVGSAGAILFELEDAGGGGDATATPATIDVVITPQAPIPDVYYLNTTVRFG